MTRDELMNAIDSPTVAALADVFSPRNTQSILSKSYSEQIADILLPRLAPQCEVQTVTVTNTGRAKAPRIDEADDDSYERGFKAGYEVATAAQAQTGCGDPSCKDPNCDYGKEIVIERAALVKINEIRNSIIGTHSLNWSEHVYPLVAALGEAGFEGMPYPEARENYGTLVERAVKAEDALKEIRKYCDENLGPSRSSLLNKIAHLADTALAVPSAHRGGE